jgi:hypothetical protein
MRRWPFSALEVEDDVDDVLLHPSIVEYSCSTPAIFTSVAA